MKQLFIALCSVIATHIYAQDGNGIGIGTTNVDPSAILEISSQNKGLLVPRMSTAEREAINQGNIASGLMVYDTDTNAFHYYDGASWLRLIVSTAQVNINMDQHKIVSLADGVNDSDAVNKRQLDTKLNISADTTLGGYINMGAHKITNLATGTDDTDAANTKQVLDVQSNLNDFENTIGLLRKGSQTLGDIAENSGENDDDESVTFSFTDVGTADYIVLGSIVGLSEDVNNDNDIAYAVYDKTATSFKVYFREISGGTQNIKFEYILIKL